MSQFIYRDGYLYAEQVAVEHIVERFGTPVYVYSRQAFEQNWRAYDDALQGYPHLVCYAVKANSNIAVLNILSRLGAGFDIVSGGELERVLHAGGDPGKVVFSGVGKRVEEIQRALEVGIRCFNVESESELERLDQIAREMGKLAPVSLRVNPDVDANTHPYISTGLKENKFGITMEQAAGVYQRAQQMPGLNIVGIDCHIGSQLTETAPFQAALERLLSLLDQIGSMGIELSHIDLGGGLGICYQDELPPTPAEYVASLLPLLADRDLEIIVEPGRSIAGNSGILVTKVEYLKPTEARNFAIVDAAMNDLLRPSLYSAWQAVLPVIEKDSAGSDVYDIVGPICETGDFLAKERVLDLESDDLLAIMSAGAYGFSMSSTYNSRPRVAEVMVDTDEVFLIRRRETIEELFAGERIMP